MLHFIYLTLKLVIITYRGIKKENNKLGIPFVEFLWMKESISVYLLLGHLAN